MQQADNLSPLEVIALVAGILGSIAAVLTYLEPHIRAWFRTMRNGPRKQDELVLPHSGDARVPLSAVRVAWVVFVREHFPAVEDPFAVWAPVAGQNDRFSALKRPWGVDAFCRQLPGARRDVRQTSREFWVLNGRFFEREDRQAQDTGRTIQHARLKAAHELTG
jgi:hypothetical protein